MKMLIPTLGALVALALLPDPGVAQSQTAVAEGAKLYGQNCVRCHSARSPMERTDREWVTIVNHMRARANMRRSDARAMIAFLQATNRPEAGAEGRRAADEAGTDPTPVVIDLKTPDLSPETVAAVERLLASLEDTPDP